MGKTVSLKKTYKEVWKKPRGSAKKVFSGHTTQYWIDGVPVKKKEYDDVVSSICDETLFKLLSNPRFFNEQLDTCYVTKKKVPAWQARRSAGMNIPRIPGAGRNPLAAAP